MSYVEAGTACDNEHVMVGYIASLAKIFELLILEGMSVFQRSLHDVNEATLGFDSYS